MEWDGKTSDTQGRPEHSPSVHHTVVAIDPGVRTFGTCYNPDGEVSKWGEGANKMIYNLTTQVWSLMGKEKSPKLRSGCDPQIIHRTRRHLRRVIAQRRERIRNLTTELHHQFAFWLVKNNNVILLPTFEVTNMVQKRDETGKWTRKIRKRTVVEFYGLSHYRFKQYLITKAKK